ncbi:MAG TPA: hypothetical protein VMT53_22250 [Terriglobales bacterium]|nr:hypothetical protein [Terriglobales bacterium]
MSNIAKLYIACTSAIGFTVLIAELLRWSAPNPLRFAMLLLLTVVASTLKVRLPGLTSTISASFLFVLIGVADFSLPETLAVGCAAALVQSLWKATAPKPVHVIFNVASWAISIYISYWLSHRLVAAAQIHSLAVLLPFAAFLFFLTHTGFVALVVSLTSQSPLKAVWRDCYFWTFPYYLVGAAIAGVFALASRTVGWQVSLLVLPMMYLVYGCYRVHISRALNGVQPR